jgi:NAD-dependent SIR2 family protein deacetylase
VNDTDPPRCPRCLRPFVILIGDLGPCDPCAAELAAERAVRRETSARPHPCRSCGAELIGRAVFFNEFPTEVKRVHATFFLLFPVRFSEDWPDAGAASVDS